MAIFVIKTGGRAVFRQSHILPPKERLLKSKKPPVNIISKRCHASNSNGSLRPRPDDDVVNGSSIPVPNTVAALPLWQRLGPLSRGFTAYARSQRKRPYATQFVSSLVIYFLGDMSAQNINGDEYDPARTARALVISAGSSIPAYKWFMFLGNNFNYSSKLLSLATKVTVNQIVFTPIFNTYFFGMQSLLSGDALPQVWERIQRTVPTSMLNSCKLWPAVTAFSFTFIHAQYRSIFAGVVAIGWQTYLSYLNRKAELHEAAERAALAVEVGATRELRDEQQQVTRGVY